MKSGFESMSDHRLYILSIALPISKSDTYSSLLNSVYIQTIILQITQQKANNSLGADKVLVSMHTPETLLQIH